MLPNEVNENSPTVCTVGLIGHKSETLVIIPNVPSAPKKEFLIN